MQLRLLLYIFEIFSIVSSARIPFAMEEDGTITSIISLSPGTEASIEYEWALIAKQRFSPHRTVYTFFHIFFSECIQIGHPAEATNCTLGLR